MIDRVWVSGIRNLGELKLRLDPVSYVVGPNNQGKTNFLESIHFALTGRGVGGSGVSDLRAFDRRGIGAVGVGLSGTGSTIYRKVDAPREPVLDSVKVSQGAVSKLVVADYWSADLIRSVQESPDIRRQVIHRYCALVDPNFMAHFNAYRRILGQRNAALKAQNRGAVSVYSPALIDAAFQLVKSRESALQELGSAMTMLLNGYDEYRFDVRVKQVCRHIAFGDYCAGMATYLRTNTAKEYALGYTTVGPHRDDIQFFADSTDLVRFLSRGVNRLFAILLHLLMFRLIRSVHNAHGVLGLDDVFSEIATPLALGVLSEVADGNQVIVASTSVSEYLARYSGSVFKVDRGFMAREN